MQISRIILEFFIPSLLLGFTGALAPGPLLTVTINETLRREKQIGFQISLGHALLELILVIVLGKFLLNLLAKSDTLAENIGGVIGIIGGGFILWMGYSLLKDSWQGKLAIEAGAKKPYAMHPIAAGAFVSLANPYWTVWWLSVGAAFLVKSVEVGVAGVAAFYLGHIMADFSWYMLVSWAVLKGKKVIRDKVYKWIMVICAALISFFGLYFVYSGLKFLL